MNTSDPGSDLARMDKGKTRPGTIARGLGLKVPLAASLQCLKQYACVFVPSAINACSS